tara:strand:- start:4029 stop:4646 length:618 start_codon:yes stop_codon:yes gene_type:complete
VVAVGKKPSSVPPFAFADDGTTQLKQENKMSRFEDLKKPFPAEKIHWRVGATNKEKTKGIALAYLDARDVMERLDEVVGPENWQAEYPFVGCCRIGIRCKEMRADGVSFTEQWVWKSNGAGETDVEGEKGQYSDAFKRAAVLWGIGRYLYDLPNTWVPIKPQGRSYVLATTPPLPTWAVPSPYTPKEEGEMYKQSVKDELQDVFK